MTAATWSPPNPPPKPDEPPSTTVPRGFFAFSPRIFEVCRAVEPSPTGEYELTAAVDRLLWTGGRVETVATGVLNNDVVVACVGGHA